VPVGAGNSWGITAIGGEINHVLDGNELTYHDHGIYDPTHAHAIADPGHNHYFNDPWHAHPMGDPGHAHGGVVVPGGTDALGYAGWNTQPGNTAAAGTGVYTGAAPTNAWNSGSGTGIGIYGNYTGVLTYANGGSWGHNNMQPFVAMNYIIRYA
jgi:microcystin-dependent protein